MAGGLIRILPIFEAADVAAVVVDTVVQVRVTVRRC